MQSNMYIWWSALEASNLELVLLTASAVMPLALPVALASRVMKLLHGCEVPCDFQGYYISKCSAQETCQKHTRAHKQLRIQDPFHMAHIHTYIKRLFPARPLKHQAPCTAAHKACKT